MWRLLLLSYFESSSSNVKQPAALDQTFVTAPVRIGRIVPRDYSDKDQASTAAIVSLVVDIEIDVIDVVGPVAHAPLHLNE